MDFFNSLTLDLKLLVVGMAGCVLLGLFASNKKTEKRVLVLFAVLAVAGIYRFTHLPQNETAARRAAATPMPQSPPVAQKKKPLESTFAK